MVKHSETDLQIEVVSLLESMGIPCIHIANERNTGQVELHRLEKMGVRKGAPDLLVGLNGRTEWWELKSDKGSLSPEQKCFFELAEQFGAKMHLIRTLDDAKKRLI